MRVTIGFGGETAVLVDDPIGETVRILRVLADRVESGEFGEGQFANQSRIVIHDLNGNQIGEFVAEFNLRR